MTKLDLNKDELALLRIAIEFSLDIHGVFNAPEEAKLITILKKIEEHLALKLRSTSL